MWNCNKCLEFCINIDYITRIILTSFKCYLFVLILYRSQCQFVLCFIVLQWNSLIPQWNFELQCKLHFMTQQAPFQTHLIYLVCFTVVSTLFFCSLCKLTWLLTLEYFFYYFVLYFTLIFSHLVILSWFYILFMVTHNTFLPHLFHVQPFSDLILATISIW